jgi:hypothetical protein
VYQISIHLQFVTVQAQEYIGCEERGTHCSVAEEDAMSDTNRATAISASSAK